MPARIGTFLAAPDRFDVILAIGHWIDIVLAANLRIRPVFATRTGAARFPAHTRGQPAFRTRKNPLVSAPTLSA